MANPQPVPFSPAPAGGKSPEAFRTISEVAAELDLPQHVLRFWETRFAAVRPLKRSGGRRYYRPEDVVLLRRIRDLLREKGYTIKGVQKLLRHGSERALSENEKEKENVVEVVRVAEIHSESGSGDESDGDVALNPRAFDGNGGSRSMISADKRDELAALLSELEELRLLVKSV